MKKISFTLVFLLIMKIAWTQNTYLDFKSALKIYNLTTFEEQTKSQKLNDTSSYSFQYTTTTLQILHPTIAFQWKTSKNNFHEIELTSLILGRLGTKTEKLNDTTNDSQRISGSNITKTAISVRYEYILNFNKSKDHKLVPSLGFAINPYYRQNNYSPKVATSFPTSETNIGMNVFITPRITYFLTSKLFIDVNVPLCFFNTFLLIEKENNPTIPIQERTINTFNLYQFPKIFSGRIGIGLKL